MKDEYIEDDDPIYEAEYCERCFKYAEDNDIEYEFKATWRDGGWVCDDCGHGC